MKRIIRTLHERIDSLKGVLRHKLEQLPQRTRLIVVLSMFALFSICALITFISALYEIGSGKGEPLKIEHIKQLDLHSRQDSIHLNNYDYGTEQESDISPERGENETAAD